MQKNDTEDSCHSSVPRPSSFLRVDLYVERACVPTCHLEGSPGGRDCGVRTAVYLRCLWATWLQDVPGVLVRGHDSGASTSP